MSWLDPFRRRILLGFLRRIGPRLTKGRLQLSLPDGERRELGSQNPGVEAEIRLRDWRFTDRLMRGGTVGFAQAYLDDFFDTPDLKAVIDFALDNRLNVGTNSIKARGIFAQALRRYHAARTNTVRQARDNIEAHYDLGNAFYALWLDPSMTYSSAYFTEATTDLEAAQQAKYDRLAAQLQLQPGQRLLEIGCGWGGAAERFCGTYGVQLTGLTLSPSQLGFAQERMARLGLSEQSDLRLEDYREHSGRDYDALLSIEMFEAVGEAYWPAYFQTVFAALKPSGRAALQIITINDSDFDDYRRNPDFIQRYVFPGGMLATLRHLRELSAEMGLQWRDAFSLRESYARTLLTWRERFWAAWPEIEPQGFDARFWRLWTYYLTYCASGFEEKVIDVYQILLQKPER